MYFNGIEGLLDAKYCKSRSYEEWQLVELARCKQDIIYWCKTYFKINDPVKGISIWDGMWDFQIDFIRMMASNIHIMAKWPRQVGKSTCTRAYLLWYTIFHKDKNIAILANKQDLAVEQLGLIKDSYMELPEWMQMGVGVWNARNIELGNGSRIVARATSKDAIRGMTLDKVYLDEFAFVEDSIAEAFWNAVLPTVSNNPERNIIITSTPRGTNFFFRLWNDAEAGKNFFTTVEIPWNARPGRDEAWAKEMIATMGEIQFNQEFRCAFEGSDTTLISMEFLKKIQERCNNSTYIEPKYPDSKKDKMEGKIKIYEKPVDLSTLKLKKWQYVASLDTALGIQEDYTVLQIALVKTNRDMEQVAVFRSNDIPVRDFAELCLPLLKAYHNPLLIIEANGPGDSMITYMNDVFYYDNLVHFDPTGRRLGVVPSAPVKFKALILLKAYLEKNLFKLNDLHTTKELMAFGKVGNTFKGKYGTHDDLVTSLQWIPYYVNSPMYWGEIDYEELQNHKSLLEIPNDTSVIEHVIETDMVKVLTNTGVHHLDKFEKTIHDMDDVSPQISSYEMVDEI